MSKKFWAWGAISLAVIALGATGFYARSGNDVKVMFLHQSTGRNLYEYPAQGVPAWFKEYNKGKESEIVVRERWYPKDDYNMPADYHKLWFQKGDGLSKVVASNDVVVMKHCYPASAIVADNGKADPASQERTLENYKAFYRLLREEFKQSPEKLFVLWTLPPLNPLGGVADSRLENAKRAKEFSEWIKSDFLAEDKDLKNVAVWDVRSIWEDPATHLLKTEYMIDPAKDDSHPNDVANNLAGPQFAEFLAKSVEDFKSRNPGWKSAGKAGAKSLSSLFKG